MWMAMGLALLVTTSAPAAAQQKVNLVFSSGPTGGSWIPMAAAIADVVKKKFPEIEVQVEPGGTNVNLEKIRTDKADIGWSFATALFDIRAGRGYWQGKQSDKHVVIANVYPNVWQFVVLAESNIHKIADLKGKPVALPDRTQSSLTEGWDLLLKVNGMTQNDLGTRSYGKVSENAELLKDQKAVAMAWFTAVPASFVLDLGSSRKIRMLQIDDATVGKLRELNAGFARHVIPKGTYTASGIEEEIRTYQTPGMLVVSSRTPADAMYKVTKAIVEGRDQLATVAPVMKTVTAQTMVQTLGVPLHPGAAKYYKEIGVLK
jgi:TRAP transporter TAXI family solute receptor